MKAMKRTILIGVGIVLGGVGYFQARGQEPPSAAPQGPAAQYSAAQYSATMGKYCFTCHNDKLKTADLILSKEDVSNPSANPEVWEKVVRKLRARGMPPVGMPRPDNATYDAFATYLETELDHAAVAKPDPGRPTAAHRLNRTEYINSVRDLLALDIDGSALLPADDSGGFDNLGDLLSVSPGLMEKYVSAAAKIGRLAVGDPDIHADVATYTVSPLMVQGDRMSEDLPFGTRGGIAVRHLFPLDGEYVIKIRLQRTDNSAFVIGIAEPHRLDVRVDDARVKLFTFGGEHVGLARGSGAADALPPDFKEAEYERHADDGMEVRFPASAGERLVQVAFLKETLATESSMPPHGHGTLAEATLQNENERGSADPEVASVAISGPFNAKGSGDTPSRRKIFVCNPAAGKTSGNRAQLVSLKTGGDNDEEACAKKVLSSLARRAYRRPVTDADVQRLLKLYKAGRSEGGFEAGVEMALQGILVSTEFLFRIERDPAGVSPDTPYRLSDVELASRLSYFLWSSIPDEELLSLAERGKLKDPAVLEQQVRRLFADPRSKALVDNFAAQWLYLRNLKIKTPNRDVYPDFDENLRAGFAQETELFLESMLREDRPVLDLLTADYTFLNERLARHYSVPNVFGNQFRRVTLIDDNRKGLLGQGSVLTLTALANRTSVVQRGKWVLENILGSPVPPPPPNVPPLKEKSEGAKGTLRQQMEAHRANPACFVCHSRMDPIGFAMENFDGIGKYRTVDDGAPIDSSGTLPDGSKFQGIAELRKALLNRPDLIVYGITEKLMTYALGRQLEPYDAPAVRKIIREAAPSESRWSAIILGITKSTPFQMRRSRPS
jgi:hypothetical protein